MAEQAPKKINWLAFVPLIIFAMLAGVFALQLFSGKNANELPSVLIGQASPETDLPALDPALPGIKSVDFKGRVTVLNVFASWCVPCRDEHPSLIALTKDARFTLSGLNYKDKPDQATNFLKELGNPYDEIGADVSGRAGIMWGVYGVPETYVIGKDGTIKYKFTGPLDPDKIKSVLLPEIEKVLAL